MALPSFDVEWRSGQRIPPRTQVLLVRDREKPEAPARWRLFVEREEEIRRDPRNGEILEANIRLHYQTIEANHSRAARVGSSFKASYSRGFGEQPSVSVAAHAVFCDPPELRGHRVGTYLMTELVKWAKQWPDATVAPVSLLFGQADEENKDRRNTFYERYGLVFNYTDDDKREGDSIPMLVADLKVIESWKQNIDEQDVRDFVGGLLYERDRLSQSEARIKAINQSNADALIAARAQPVRWAAGLVLQSLRYRLMEIIGLIVLALVVWAALQSI